jgi:primosomal protein N' (replication factor Y) (superfamily II helicase)
MPRASVSRVAAEPTEASPEAPEASHRCVEVALPVPLFRTFTYRVPDALPMPMAGQRVVVPFRTQRDIGIVLGAVAPPEGVTLKAVQAVPDRTPALPPPLLATARWIADYYAAPIGLTVRSLLPVALTRAAAPQPAERLRRVVRLVHSADGPLDSLMAREALFARAPKQRTLLELLEARGGEADAVLLLQQAGMTDAVLDGLVKKGLVRVEREVSVRDPFGARAHVEPPAQPTPAQHAAVQAIVGGTPGQTFLLHGITGSGKTLVYIEVLRHVVRTLGRTAIVLVPEIALTPQTVDRFRGAFGDDVAVLHSALSDGERYDAWRALRDGTRRIAVGARSALFAPLRNVGAIIVDEEHDASYKQAETPRYHAREAAIVRAREEGAVVVLGSATPSLETWERAERGRITRLDLPQRATGASLPSVQVVDLRAVTRDALAGRAPNAPFDETIGVLSPTLIDAITVRLSRGEQSVLLLNRRGFAAFLECRDCGDVTTCPHCSIALTYHRVPESLVCHYCQHRAPVHATCGACGGVAISRRGLGTQQVERVVAERFPEARIARMDVDTTSGKWAHATILDRVAAGEVDILLGTQMIAKGLDFPNVTLVGVIDADTGLNLPDFRASERTFQLLSQVSGRSGRGEKPGEVLVQTRRPTHHAVQCAVRHDLRAFVEAELAERRAPAYPPFVQLANVVVSGLDEQVTSRAAIATADWTRALLRDRNIRSVEVVGPAPCAIHRIKERWRWHFFLRTPDGGLLSRLSRFVASRAPAARDAEVRLVVDRDPVALL